MSKSYDAHYAAGGFQYTEAHRDWLRREVVDRFSLRELTTILDAGCGDGFWTAVLAGEGLQATGIDQSDAGIGIARERYPEATFEVADVEKPLGLGRSFDAVFIRNLSHMLREDLSPATEVLRNLATALVPNGHLIVVQYSNRSGEFKGSAVNHPLSAYVRAVEPVAEISSAYVVDDYALIKATV